MPIDYSKYPADWKEKIRPDILRRAGYRCETCRARHKAIGYRDSVGVFHECDPFEIDHRHKNNDKTIRIILTIAHMDHTTTNNDYSNLKALCQKCHLNYDRSNNILRRKSKILFTGFNQKN